MGSEKRGKKRQCRINSLLWNSSLFFVKSERKNILEIKNSKLKDYSIISMYVTSVSMLSGLYVLAQKLHKLSSLKNE